jgi:hypothetical protein
MQRDPCIINVDVASASHLSDSTAPSIFFFCLKKKKRRGLLIERLTHTNKYLLLSSLQNQYEAETTEYKILDSGATKKNHHFLPKKNRY